MYRDDDEDMLDSESERGSGAFDYKCLTTEDVERVFNEEVANLLVQPEVIRTWRLYVHHLHSHNLLSFIQVGQFDWIWKFYFALEFEKRP